MLCGSAVGCCLGHAPESLRCRSLAAAKLSSYARCSLPVANRNTRTFLQSRATQGRRAMGGKEGKGGVCREQRKWSKEDRRGALAPPGQRSARHAGGQHNRSRRLVLEGMLLGVGVRCATMQRHASSGTGIARAPLRRPPSPVFRHRHKLGAVLADVQRVRRRLLLGQGKQVCGGVARESGERADENEGVVCRWRPGGQPPRRM